MLRNRKTCVKFKVLYMVTSIGWLTWKADKVMYLQVCMNLYLKYKDVSDFDSLTEKALFDTFVNHLASFEKYVTIMLSLHEMKRRAPCASVLVLLFAVYVAGVPWST